MLLDDEKINFESTLKQLSEKYSVPIYSLLDDYHETEIWSGMNHIAMNQSASIYRHDVAMIGLDVLQ